MKIIPNKEIKKSKNKNYINCLRNALIVIMKI